MAANRKFGIISIIIIGIVFSLLPVYIAFAQGLCPGNRAVILVDPNKTLFIRKSAGGDIPGNSPPLGTLTASDGAVEIDNVKDGFLHLVKGGWIVNQHLSILRCVSPVGPTFFPQGTPTKVTVTPTPLASPTPSHVWICDVGHCSEFTIPYVVSTDRRKP